MFAQRPDLDVRSAGTSEEALARVNAHMLAWADLVFVMEDQQRDANGQMFPDHPALERMVCLEIPDAFPFLDRSLIALLEERVTPHLARHDERGFTPRVSR